MSSSAAKSVSEALLTLTPHGPAARTVDDLMSATSTAQSALQNGCSYDDAILAKVILGLFAASFTGGDNPHAPLKDRDFDLVLQHFQEAVTSDAARGSGAYVFSDASRRQYLWKYQEAIILKAQQLRDSVGETAAIQFLLKSLSSFAYLGNDYWTLIHAHLGYLYAELFSISLSQLSMTAASADGRLEIRHEDVDRVVNKLDLARTHFRAAIDACPLLCRSEDEDAAKEEAKARLAQVEETATLSAPISLEAAKEEVKARLAQLEKTATSRSDARAQTRVFMGSWKILGAVGGLGILGIAYVLSTGDIQGLPGSLIFLGLAFGYWKWKSR